MSNIENCVLEKLNYDIQGNLTPFETSVTAQIGEFGTIILNLKPSNPSEIKIYPNAKNGLYNASIQEYRYVEGNPLVGQFTYDANASALVFNNAEVGNHIMANINAIGKTFMSGESVATKYDSRGQVFETLSNVLETLKKHQQLSNPTEHEGYGFELMNFSGQGKYPYGDSRNGNFKAMVVHNYTDSELLVLDNVGDAPTLRLGGCRNPVRRADKPIDYCARPNPIQLVQAFMNPDGVTHSNLTLWNMDWAGNLWYRSTKPSETKAPQIMTATQELASSGYFAMTIGSWYETRLILNLVYASGKSAFKFYIDGAKNSIIQTTEGGFKSIAYKLDNTVESTEGNVILKATSATGEALVNVDGINKVIGRFVPTPPPTKTTNGKRGDFSADVNYIYVCYATNAWHRIAKDNTW